MCFIPFLLTANSFTTKSGTEKASIEPEDSSIVMKSYHMLKYWFLFSDALNWCIIFWRHSHEKYWKKNRKYQKTWVWKQQNNNSNCTFQGPTWNTQKGSKYQYYFRFCSFLWKSLCFSSEMCIIFKFWRNWTLATSSVS